MTNLSAERLLDELGAAVAPSSSAAAAVRARIDDILRPPGALERLDELAIWLAAWQRTDAPDVRSPSALVFAGDHGVTVEGVSAFASDVTASMMDAFDARRASISAIASIAGAEVHAIDVGVGIPTGNLRIEPAMTLERFRASFARGREAVRSVESDLLVLGEMGIGNSTAAAAVSAALLGDEASPFVGRGTGLDDVGLSNKARVVDDALRRIHTVSEPLEILRQVGGTELAAIAGAIVESRMRSIPVLLDGYIATSPALVLHAIDPDLVAHVRAGHRSAEPGHHIVLEHLGLEPILTLDMRLGEASGAMAAVPIVAMACRLANEVPTFAEWFGSP